MKEKNKEHCLMDKLEFIKNPLIAEFLGYSLEDKYTETELETSIINNLQNFLMELRKRLCFKVTHQDIGQMDMYVSEQLFATKYKTYLPTEEELKAEIESQKAIFEIQQLEKKENNTVTENK